MTLTEAQALCRMYSRLSTVNVSTTDLTTYIQRAELATALDLLNRNPATALAMDNFVWTANAFSMTLTTALLTNLGANRSVYKVLSFGEITDDQKSWSWLTPGEPQDLGGYSWPRDLRDNSGTSHRWMFSGDKVYVYPLYEAATDCTIVYTRVPKLAATGTDLILQDFTTAAQVYAELVVLRAAQFMLHERGGNTEWVDAQIQVWIQRIDQQFGTFQQQETPSLPGVRYETKAAE